MVDARCSSDGAMLTGKSQVTGDLRCSVIQDAHSWHQCHEGSVPHPQHLCSKEWTPNGCSRLPACLAVLSSVAFSLPAAREAALRKPPVLLVRVPGEPPVTTRWYFTLLPPFCSSSSSGDNLQPSSCKEYFFTPYLGPCCSFSPLWHRAVP